jgi:hypothetical protein
MVNKSNRFIYIHTYPNIVGASKHLTNAFNNKNEVPIVRVIAHALPKSPTSAWTTLLHASQKHRVKEPWIW